MKTITIRLSDVEVAMLAELQKKNKVFKDLQKLIERKMADEYMKISSR